VYYLVLTTYNFTRASWAWRRYKRSCCLWVKRVSNRVNICSEVLIEDLCAKLSEVASQAEGSSWSRWCRG